MSRFQFKKRSVLSSFAAAATTTHRICPASSVRPIMLSFAILSWFFVSAISDESINSFHKGKSTEKPDVLYKGSPIPKPRKPPTHISEFTDPDTGLNPFLDLEEGPTSAGRNVMKDERRKDPPFFDFELVEGDAPERRWGLEVPKEPLEEPIQRWPPLEDNVQNPPTTTIQYDTEKTPMTTESHIKTSVSEEPYNEKRNEEHKIIKDISTSSVSTNSMIYASATVVAVAALALLTGVCWWRRKLKRTSQSTRVAENGELKS